MDFFIRFEKSWTTWLHSVLQDEGIMKQIVIAAVLAEESLAKGLERADLVF